MPAALPLVEDSPGETPSLWSFGGGAETSAGPVSAGVGGRAALNPHEGGAPESAHLWMAGVMILALLGLIALHVTGFRGMVDVGVASR